MGESPGLKAARRLARIAAADGECSVLLTGETGTGKELLAQEIHSHSPRSNAPFRAINAATLPPQLAESLLFGHSRGAFTGAGEAVDGLLRSADGGTVFLDEIQELDLGVQAKLLRFLQDHQVVPLGGTRSHTVDLRIIAGSNQDLSGAVDAGTFRADLYFRLHVLPIVLPPLRDRSEDIPALVDYFLEQINRGKGTSVTFAPEALAALMAYPWPGNIRELRNLIERLVIVHRSGAIGQEELPDPMVPGRCPAICTPLKTESNFKAARQQLLSAFERQFIYRHWQRNDWNITRTAAEIGQSREWLSRSIAKYRLKPNPSR